MSSSQCYKCQVNRLILDLLLGLCYGRWLKETEADHNPSRYSLLPTPWPTIWTRWYCSPLSPANNRRSSLLPHPGQPSKHGHPLPKDHQPHQKILPTHTTLMNLLKLATILPNCPYQSDQPTEPYHPIQLQYRQPGHQISTAIPPPWPTSWTWGPVPHHQAQVLKLHEIRLLVYIELKKVEG